VGIAGQILENLIGAAKWWFGIDDPFRLAGLETQRLESRWFGKRFQMSTELEFALLEGAAQVSQKPLTEESAEDLHWKEERFPARDPARLIGAESATGHHAMNVGMNMQILTPGVQHGQEADCR